MRISRAAIVIAALLLAVTPARADWQNTRWGMTPEQAARVKGLQASPTPFAGMAEYRVHGVDPGLIFDYRSGALSFQGAMYFEAPNRGLSMIKLRLKDPNQWTALVAALMQRYGQPAQDKPMSLNSRLIRWYTPAEEVTYFHQLIGEPTASASVTYIGRSRASGRGL